MNRDQSPFTSIFAETDELGLLNSGKAAPTRSTEEEIAIGQFEAINSFIDEHGVAPGSTADDREPNLSEYGMEAHLEAFKGDERYRVLLAPLDRHGLLGAASTIPPTSIAEIITSEDPLLEDSPEIFDLKHVTPPSKSIDTPDEIARRQVCADFDTFAPIFTRIESDLANGRRKTVPFEGEGSVKPGAVFVFHGLTAYIAEASEKERRGKNYNARTRVIFSNGTESNLLLRSFARALYDDEQPRQIVETAPAVSGPLFSGEAELPEGSLHTGIIYVLESESDAPDIIALRGRLFKIGFTVQTLEKRIANAETDATFLYARVRRVAIFDAYNVDPQKIERLIHQFFGNARLNVDIVLGRTVSPKEWFVVPLDLVREAITRILDGSIVKYRYDSISRKIVPR